MCCWTCDCFCESQNLYCHFIMLGSMSFHRLQLRITQYDWLSLKQSQTGQVINHRLVIRQAGPVTRHAMYDIACSSSMQANSGLELDEVEVPLIVERIAILRLPVPQA